MSGPGLSQTGSGMPGKAAGGPPGLLLSIPDANQSYHCQKQELRLL